MKYTSEQRVLREFSEFTITRRANWSCMCIPLSLSFYSMSYNYKNSICSVHRDCVETCN